MNDEKALIDELWPALEPPPNFSARVTAALDGVAAQRAPARSRRRMFLGLASLGVAAVLALLITQLVTRPREAGRPAWGEVQALARETVGIGDRAVAVAEPGAQLSWSLAAGRIRVDQRGGTVFYRVDHGAPFVVSTAAADVHVTGTCFQVEHLGSAGVAVRVFEGAVAVSNPEGSVAISAGERVQVEPGHAPLRASSLADGSLVRRDRDRVKQLEQALHQARREAGELPGVTPEHKYLDFTPEELKALGARCEFRYARPEHLIGFGPPDLGGRFGLDERERAAVVQIMEDQRTRFVEELRSIYVEIVGDRTTASKLSPIALVDEINSKSRPGEDVEARNRLFDEWTGKARAPSPETVASRPAVERFWRLISGASDTFIRRLSEVVGPERARAIAGATIHDRVQIAGPCGRFEKK
jgi:hypothetical protein